MSKNTEEENNLEMALMALFTKTAEFGRVFLTSATKEEFAESVNNGAIDPQQAAHDAMLLVKSFMDNKSVIDFEHGRAVGKYQAADSLYGHTTTMWVFKDGDLNDKKIEYPERINELLKDCEALMNTNAREYTKYINKLLKEKRVLNNEAISKK